MAKKAIKRKTEQKIPKRSEPETVIRPQISTHQPTSFSAYGYKDHELPEKMRVPFILTRYRCPCLTAEQCVESLFQPHNETVNMWSHIIALGYFIVHNMDVIREYRNLDDPLVLPLICSAIGIVTLLIMSVCTHTFNSMSLLAYHVCYFFDYAAISICTFTTAQAMFFYSRPLITTWSMFNSPIAFLSFVGVNSLVSTFTCCAVLVRRPWYHSFVRTSVYLSLGLFTVLPYMGRLALCSYIPTDECTTGSFIHFKHYCLYLVIAGITYAYRIPERLLPKMFDLLGQSHHILHVLSAMALSEMFTAVHIDMRERRKNLLSKPQPWAELCIVFTGLAVALNLAIVAWFSRSLYRRLARLRKAMRD